MLDFFAVLKSSFPRSRLFDFPKNSQIRAYFQGFSDEFPRVQQYFIDVKNDAFCDTTRALDAWEKQFNLPASDALTEEQRRQRICNSWSTEAIKTASQIQEYLRSSGFENVYVFSNTYVVVPGPAIRYGAPRARYGSGIARYGNTVVNTVEWDAPYRFHPTKEAAEAAMIVNGRVINNDADTGTAGELLQYEITEDLQKWAFYWFVCGENLGDFIDIPAERREEFETLILKVIAKYTRCIPCVNYI